MKWFSAAGLTALAALALISSASADKPASFSPAQIDKSIRAEWNKQKVVPASPVDDARFLRRIYLDIAGVIPPADAVTSFLADRAPGKRERAVESLLNSPRYAENWTNYWDNILMGKQVRVRFVDRFAFRQWLRTQFDRNVPWNKFVYDLITASGQNSTGGSYAKIVGMRARPGEREEPVSAEELSRVNGAVNWILKYQMAPADLSGAASKIFLGVQIQCAQCHDHKTEKWKQEDFRKLTACFINTRPRPVADMMAQGKMAKVDLIDVPRPFIARAKNLQARNEYVNAQPAALDGTDFSNSSNRRAALAGWMTAPENPWFAEAIVNRMWSHFMGRGFVEPVDDFRESNPAIMPDLLKRLSDDFVAHDYDLKHLIETITATKVYQLSSGQAKTDPGNTLWARYRLKPMGPEQLMDSLVSATNLGPVLERMFGGNLDVLKTQLQRQFTFLFDTDEEQEQKDFEGTIPQALLMLNGNITNRGASPIPGTTLAEIMSMPGSDEGKIAALYLRTLSRKPTAAELARWTKFIRQPRNVIVNDSPIGEIVNRRALRMQNAKQQAKRGPGPDPLNRLAAGRFEAANPTARQQAYEDLFWALLNSSEFVFNH